MFLLFYTSASTVIPDVPGKEDACDVQAVTTMLKETMKKQMPADNTDE